MMRVWEVGVNDKLWTVTLDDSGCSLCAEHVRQVSTNLQYGTGS